MFIKIKVHMSLGHLIITVGQISSGVYQWRNWNGDDGASYHWRGSITNESGQVNWQMVQIYCWHIKNMNEINFGLWHTPLEKC